MTMELPPDILFYKILPRLPAKSIGRFRTVSKQWHSVLRTPLFEKLHLQHATNDHHQNHHKLLIIPYDSPCVFNTIDCEAPEDGLTPSRLLPFDFDPSSEKMKLLTSFDGLICVGIAKLSCGDEYSDLILWNPLTGDYKKLSKPDNSHKACYKRRRKAFGLYYSDDDYKLLSVTRDSDAYIYSLKSDSWRKVDSSSKDLKKGIDNRISKHWWPSTLLNENLYFLNYADKRDPLDPSHRISYYSIIRFDTNTEKFTEIATPSFGVPDVITCFNHQGCIHVYGVYGVIRLNSIVFGVELWRMDGDGGDWKKVVVSDPIPNSMCIKPLHLMRDGNCLIHSISEGLVYKIDLATNTKNLSCSFSARGLDTSPTGKYIQTLVSPNRYL
ncbi:unnamed protein product [Lactuca saligna]|uniref:F-box domain-containing protein n=1 Tax=Lactuca saligna TaxID=75948 RepID=A0AA36EAT0_LACSI|nr:unnamed protein product [Lactuca saligna]